MKLATRLLELLEKFDPKKYDTKNLAAWVSDTKAYKGKANDSLRDVIEPIEAEGKKRLLSKLSKLTLTKNFGGKIHFLLFRGESYKTSDHIVNDVVVHTKRTSWTPIFEEAFHFGGNIGSESKIIQMLMSGDFVNARVLSAWISEDDIVTSPVMFNSKGREHSKEWEVIVGPHKSKIPTQDDLSKVLKNLHGGKYDFNREINFQNDTKSKLLKHKQDRLQAEYDKKRKEDIKRKSAITRERNKRMREI